MARKKTAKGEDYGDFFESLEALAKEKGIDSGILAEKIKSAIEKSLMSNLRFDADIEYEKKQAEPDEEKLDPAHYVCVDFDIKQRKFEVFVLKEVIEEIDSLYEPEKEIVLEEARRINPRADIGDRVRVALDPKTFKRIAAKNAKDMIRQKLSDAERQKLSEIWGEYENDAVSALVSKIEPATGNVILEINKHEATLSKDGQIPNETFTPGQYVKVFISGVSKEIKEGEKSQYLRISRTDKRFIKRLFEQACPEIYDGTVEIKAVSRVPGSRSKIAVMSNDENVDAVGACIGPQKMRINAVTKEVGGEKVDVVLYSDDDSEFIKQALKPADVIEVILTDPNPDKRSCKVIVPDNQLSLAIGNKGQNAWLAAKLTNYKIDIKAESAVVPEDYETVPLREPEKTGDPETSGEAEQPADETGSTVPAE